MQVVCFGQQNWDYCWTGKQHLMVGLARRGHQVLYVDPDSIETPTRRDRWRALAPVATGVSLRRTPDGVLIHTHVHAPPLRYRLNQWRRPAILSSTLERLGFNDPVVLTLHPSAAPLAATVRSRARVHYAVDESTAFPNLSPAEREQLRAFEEQLIRSADVVLGISPRLVARLGARHPRTYLQPSGAAVEAFAPGRLAALEGHPDLVSLPAPRLGVIGQIDERVNQPLVVTLARSRRDWQFVLVGRVKPGVDVSTLLAEPNIHLIGYIAYEQLPSVMRELDVGLVPYVLNDLTQSCSPLKVYEYLAAGLPVVSSPLDGLGDCRHVVSVASSADEFGRAVVDALREPSGRRQERLMAAASVSWVARVTDLELRLDQAIRVSLAMPMRQPAEAVKGRAAACLPGQNASAGPEDSVANLYAGEGPPSLKSRLAFSATRAAGWLYYALRVAARAVAGRRPLLVHRILVARQCRLGDLVAFGPTLAALRARYPAAHIELGVQPGAPVSLVDRSLVDEIRTMEPLDLLPAWRRVAGHARLFALGFDLVISGAGFMLMRDAFYTGAPRLVGLDDGHPLQAWNTTRVPYDVTRHEAENNLALVQALGQTWRGAASVPVVVPSNAARNGTWSGLSREIGIPSEAPFVVLHTGAQKPSRRWPAERFAELTARLLAADARLFVVFTGTSAETGLVRSVVEAVPDDVRDRARMAAGRTSFDALQAIVLQSRVIVSNDTGMMHLARAMGAPLVALLGPENPRRWGPHPFGRAPAIALRYAVPCAPCLKWDCSELYCLRRLPVDEVFDAVTSLLQARATSGASFHPVRLVERVCSWDDLSRAGLAITPHWLTFRPMSVAGDSRARG
ncbi:MAG: glycosyltransferase family 9 protein [Vicinamibacterales bacterium]